MRRMLSNLGCYPSEDKLDGARNADLHLLAVSRWTAPALRLMEGSLRSHSFTRCAHDRAFVKRPDSFGEMVRLSFEVVGRPSLLPICTVG